MIYNLDSPPPLQMEEAAEPTRIQANTKRRSNVQEIIDLDDEDLIELPATRKSPRRHVSNLIDSEVDLEEIPTFPSRRSVVTNADDERDRFRGPSQREFPSRPQSKRQSAQSKSQSMQQSRRELDTDEQIARLLQQEEDERASSEAGQRMSGPRGSRGSRDTGPRSTKRARRQEPYDRFHHFEPFQGFNNLQDFRDILSGAMRPRAPRPIQHIVHHGPMGDYLPDNALNSYEAMIALSERIGSVKPRGVEASVVSTYPIAKYVPTSSVDEKRCNICLEDYQVGDEVKFIPDCTHRFHVACLDQWLKSGDTCPVYVFFVED
jgi:hypothetical protein